MEVYVNDMLVKSKEAKTHLNNLQETFNTLRKPFYGQTSVKQPSKILRTIWLNPHS